MKSKKSCASLILAIMMTATMTLSQFQSVFALDTVTKQYDLEGDGSPASPYIVETQDDLLYITEQINEDNSAYVGKAYELGNDISMTQDFPMIDEFSGSFDGKGYMIEDLVMKGVLPDNDKGSYRAGFIRKNSGTVKNLTLKDITLTCTGDNGTAGGPTAGGLVGENNGTIERCSVTGTINAPSYEMAAGIVGKNGDQKVVSDCFFSGDVTDDAGLICAYPGRPLTVQNNVAISGTITLAYPDYSIDGFVGRIVGYTGNSVKMINNYGGTEIRIKNQTVTSMNVNSQHGLDKTDSELKTQDTYEALGWDFGEVWKMDDETGYPALQKPQEEAGVTALTGDGSVSNPFLINNEAEFLFWIEQMNLQNSVYYNEKHFRLMNDITLTDEIVMVQSFNGVLDGMGHTVHGLKIRGAVPDTNKGDYRAAMIIENSGTICNLTLANVDISCTGDNGKDQKRKK